MKKKILIVDDEQVIRETLQEVLIEEGYDVDICSNGQSAVEYVATTQCELIICDIRLPDTDGLTLVKKIHQEYPFATCIARPSHRSSWNASVPGQCNPFLTP